MIRPEGAPNEIDTIVALGEAHQTSLRANGITGYLTEIHRVHYSEVAITPSDKPRIQTVASSLRSYFLDK